MNNTVKYKLQNILNILLVFCYIFSFKIYGIIDSQIITLIFLIAIFIFSKKTRKNIVSFFKNASTKKIFLSFAAILLLSITTLLINFNADFSYIKTLLHLLISLITGIGLFGYLKTDKNINIINLIIIAFLIQSVFQWICFFLPHDIVHLFDWAKTPNAILLMKKYHYRRGLALTSTGFFGLSAGYGIAIILYGTKENTIFKKIIPKTIFFGLLISATMFVGRTTLLSLVPFIIIIAIRIIKKEVRFTRLIPAIILLITLITSIIIMLSNSNSKSDILLWAYEPILKIINTGELEISSTRTMKKMYQDYDYASTNYFIGNGEYTCMDSDKKEYYCQHVDIGWLRKLRYFGIIGIILSFILEINIIGDFKKGKLTKYLILSFLIVLEFKGEQVGIAILSNSVIILYALSINNKEKKELNIDASKR